MNNQQGVYKDKLKDTYLKDIKISKEEKFDIANKLMNLKSQKLSNNILSIAGMLNKHIDDTYFIVYAILNQYSEKITDYSKDTEENLSDKQKIEGIEASKQIIEKNISNKEFINSVYKDIRSGANIEKIFFPKQLQKELNEMKGLIQMLETLKTSERF